MKHFIKQVILLAITVCASFFPAFSQIPNPGFENWTPTGFPAYQNPDNWGNLNGSTWLGGIGVLTCERGTGADVHSGSYSMKLTSKSVFGLGDAPGITVTGTINTGTQALEGGFTYTQRPTHLKGWYKFSPMAGDSGEIRINLWRRNAGVREEVGEGVLSPTATVSSFTRFLVPITYTSASAPDSGRILLVSTNTNNIQIGSILIVDDLEFIDCSSLGVTVTATDVTYVGNADGTATAAPSGGTPPYNYYWTPNPQTTATIINLGAGTYCVTVSDANGCTATAATCGIVSEPDCSGFSVSISTTDATTTGGNDGSAAANVTGGNGSYSYLWNNVATTSSISNLVKGIYCVTVTDNLGCTSNACGTVSDPGCSSLSVNVTGTDVTMVGGSDGTATATPSGGSTPYSYLWNDSGSSTTPTISNLSAANYCVTVTDFQVCQVFGCVDVNEPDCSAFGVTLSKNDVTTVGGADGMVAANATGGTTPYVYLWNAGGTTQAVTGLDAGNYCVTVTDNVLCRDTQCIDIFEPSCAGFNVTMAITDESSAGANDGSAMATASGGAIPYSYQWSNSTIGQNLSNLSPGQYCVTSTDDNGCTAAACDSVEQGTVGILSSPSLSGIRIHPNPVSDVMIIEISDNEARSFMVYDINGKMLSEQTISEGKTTIQINLEAGNYIYVIKQNFSGQVTYGKFGVEK